MSNQAIEKLKSALQDLSGVTPFDDQGEEFVSSAESTIRAAIAQLEGKDFEQMRKDAERYRWFKENWAEQNIDAAIDAAMEVKNE